jgi:hypothetical protein
MFRGPDRVVLKGAAEIVAEVRATGMQVPDGSVDNGEDAPTIDIYMAIPGDLTSAQVRELAAVLLEAAAQVDGWVTR